MILFAIKKIPYRSISFREFYRFANNVLENDQLLIFLDKRREYMAFSKNSNN